MAGKDTAKPHFVHIDKIDLEKIATFEELPFEGQERAIRLDEIPSNSNSVGFESTKLPLFVGVGPSGRRERKMQRCG